MPSSIFNGDSVKILKDILKFKAGKRIISTSVDPSAVATAGDPGDVLINASKIFVKKDAGTSTNWDEIIDSAELVSQLANYVLVAEKGANNGVATLDAGGKLTSTQVPAIAITNTFVVASQAAQTALTAETGDVAVRTDLNKSFILASEPASSFANWQELLSPTDAVLSVFSRTGVVTAQAGDYSANQVTNVPAGNLSATDVQSALNELQTEIDNHLTDLTDAHDASAISNVPAGNLVASDVQAALNELQTDVDTRATSAALTAHEADTTNIHGIADTSLLVTTTGTQTLTNKDIDGGTASNTSRITVPKAAKTTLDALTRKQGTIVYDTTLNKPYYDDGSNLKVIGSGSSVNLIEDGDAEAGFANYIEGSYGVAARPAGIFTPSSGAGTFAISTTTTTPLSGTTSFLLTKSSGASRRGRAIERTINLELENRAKVLEMRIKYIINSGTFVAGSTSADSSLIWYIGQFNGSTWTYTEPSSFKMLSNSTTISDTLIGNFQTNSDTTQIKLIAYVAETANSAWVVECEVAIQPCNYVFGTPITDFQLVPITGSWTTNTTYTAYSRRVGDIKEYHGLIVLTGAPNAASLTINLPAGDVIDTTKIASQTHKSIGSGVIADNGIDEYAMDVFYNNTTSVLLRVHKKSGGNDYIDFPVVSQIVPNTFNAGDSINFRFSVPLVGLSSSVQVSDGFDGRLISSRVNRTAAQSIANSTSTAVAFDTIEANTTGSFSTGSSAFAVPSSGEYRISVSIAFQANATNGREVRLIVDGATIKTMGYVFGPSGVGPAIIGGSTTATLRAGQSVSIQVFQNSGGALNIGGGAAETWFAIEKILAPTTISATEVVAARYQGIPTGSIGPASNTITYPTRIFDTHNAYSGGAYTAPVSGIYHITATNEITGTEALNSETNMFVLVDGVINLYLLSARSPGNIGSQPIGGSGLVQVNAGQVIRIATYTDIASPAYAQVTIVPTFSIHRIK